MNLRHRAVLLLALLAFAGNSLLTRAAYTPGGPGGDPWLFAGIRLLAGAVVLAVFAGGTGRRVWPGLRDLPAGIALLVYAQAFTLAYVSMGAATGALILFSSVQFTMLTAGLVRGAMLTVLKGLGLLVALGGLAVLLSPGLAAPPPAAAALMAAAGVAWGIYSLIGAHGSVGAQDPVARTARNFVVAAVVAVLAVIIWPGRISAEAAVLACASGAVTSAGGYVLWYAVLPKLAPVTAASVQLSVPVITAIFGVALLGDVPSVQLLGGSAAVLAGIALTLRPVTSPSRGA